MIGEVFAGGALGIALGVLQEAVKRARDRSVTTRFISKLQSIVSLRCCFKSIRSVKKWKIHNQGESMKILSFSLKPLLLLLRIMRS
uniref:Truncated RPW8.2 n=1 Tax=Arabidopsis lyrata subsp. petraea TaxID=59691 RepID=C4P0P9_ARALP|nr:truncated RPW8.2 [Arabidopsis lyrata subsp. petraea]ACQ99494.1 truncated RPW8.2 [Arabidopsis lyrata subsp. petraea]